MLWALEMLSNDGSGFWISLNFFYKTANIGPCLHKSIELLENKNWKQGIKPLLLNIVTMSGKKSL